MKKNLRTFNKVVSISTLVAAFSMTTYANTLNVKDIEGHWAENVVAKWVNNGLISGYEDGNFKPNNTITRAEFVTVANKGLNFTNKGNANFTDVSENSWYYNEVAIATGEGYIKGYPDNTFKPNDIVTRAQVAVVLSNILNLESKESVSFSDNNEIPSWANEAVIKVVSNGYMKGYPDGTFKPNQPLTRAEAVFVLDKVKEAKNGQEGNKENNKNTADTQNDLRTSTTTGTGYDFSNSTNNGGNNNGNNGGNGGSGTVSNKTQEVKNKDELKAAISNNEVGIINIVGDIQGDIEVTRTGNTDLTINFGNSKGINSLKINAPEAKKIILSDSAEGAKVNTIIINAPKAHIENTVEVSEKIVIESVAKNTFVIKDKAPKIELRGEGKIDVLPLSQKPVVEIYTDKEVNLSGIMGNVKVNVDNSKITVEKSTTIDKIEVNQHIKDCLIKTNKDTKIELVETYSDINVSGEDGIVKDVNVLQDNVKVTINGSVIVENVNTETEFDKVEIKGDGTNKPNKVNRLAPELEGVSFEDDEATDEKTKIKLPQAGDGNSFKYKISDNDQPVKRPNIGDDTTGWIDIQNDDTFETTNGKNIGVAEADKEGKVVKFVNKQADVFANVTEEKNLKSMEESLKKLENKVSVEDGREIDKTITDLKDLVRLDKFKERIEKHAQYSKYLKLQEELKIMNDIDKYYPNKTVVLDDKGDIQLHEDIKLEFKATLKKADGSEVTVKNKEKKVENNKVSFRKEMRAAGLGKYKVILETTKDADLFETLDQGKITLTTNEQEVKKLENTLRLTIYDKNLNIKEKGSATLDFENRILSWEPVPNATSYDIYGELTIKNTEGALGTYYMNLDEESKHAENSFEAKRFIVSEDNKVQNYSNEVSLIAANVKETSISLDDNLFLPGSNVYGLSNRLNELENYEKENTSVYIWIIPRNEKSLYISKVYKNPTKDFEIQDRNSIKVSIPLTTMKNYWEKILGFEPKK
ncbi:S-layer homology domain-containing protein [[Clostridium] colinum]|uniref:S-layer homology domain-containing protein n=1 Tax=[Clostridium] colinum TaxID=36835 RepID=UPI0020258231|nr:S-layer homology domain-containing protein [[Clostridium] colinum]